MRAFTAIMLTVCVAAAAARCLRADDCNLLSATPRNCPDGVGGGLSQSTLQCHHRNGTTQACDYYYVLFTGPFGCDYMDGTTHCEQSSQLQLLQCTIYGQCWWDGERCDVDMAGYRHRSIFFRPYIDFERDCNSGGSG